MWKQHSKKIPTVWIIEGIESISWTSYSKINSLPTVWLRLYVSVNLRLFMSFLYLSRKRNSWLRLLEVDHAKESFSSLLKIYSWNLTWWWKDSRVVKDAYAIWRLSYTRQLRKGNLYPHIRLFCHTVFNGVEGCLYLFLFDCRKERFT